MYHLDLFFNRIIIKINPLLWLECG